MAWQEGWGGAWMTRGSHVAKAKETERISLDEVRKVQGRGATGSKPGTEVSS